MIINICRGGLGNRLKVLSSCYALAKKTTRELGVIWDADMRCGAVFSDLFMNDIDRVSLKSLLDSGKKISLYTNTNWIKEYNPDLLPLIKKSKLFSLDKTSNIINDKNDLVVVYSNDYLEYCSASECKAFFDWLEPTTIVREKIEKVQNSIQLDRTFIGVHARGTDFESGGTTVSTYLEKMDLEYHKDKNVKFFVCSDSLEYEIKIKNTYPYVYINDKDYYVYKKNKSSDWTNNVQTPYQSVQEALADMYLLSKTNFKIYHPHSTFAHVINMLSSGILQYNPTQKNENRYLKIVKSIKDKLFN